MRCWIHYAPLAGGAGEELVEGGCDSLSKSH